MKIKWINFVTDFHQAYNALNSDQTLQMPTPKDIEDDPWVLAQVEDLASYLKTVFNPRIDFLAREDGWLQNYYVCQPLPGCPVDMYFEGLIQTDFDSLFVTLMERIIGLYPVCKPSDFRLTPAPGYILFPQNKSSFVELNPHVLLLEGKPCLYICQLQQKNFEPRFLPGWFSFSDDEIALDSEAGEVSKVLAGGFSKLEVPLCSGRGFTVYLPQEVGKGWVFLGAPGVEPVFDDVRTFNVNALSIKKSCFTDDLSLILESACITLQTIYAQYPREKIEAAFTHVVSSKLGDLSVSDFCCYARPGVLYGQDEYSLYDFGMEALNDCFSLLGDKAASLPYDDESSFMWYGNGFSLDTSEFSFNFAVPESADEVSINALEFIEDVKNRFDFKTWAIEESFKNTLDSKKDIPFLAQQINHLLRVKYEDESIGDCVSDSRHFAYLRNTGDEVHFFLRPAPYVAEEDIFCTGQGAVYLRPGKGVSPFVRNETRFFVRQARCEKTGEWDEEKSHVQVCRDVDGRGRGEVLDVSTYILEKIREHFHIKLGDSKRYPRTK